MGSLVAVVDALAEADIGWCVVVVVVVVVAVEAWVLVSEWGELVVMPVSRKERVLGRPSAKSLVGLELVWENRPVRHLQGICFTGLSK